MKRKIVLVVAGRVDEFLYEMGQLARVHPPEQPIDGTGRFFFPGTEFRYVSTPQDMLGYHGVDILFCGTWALRRDADELRRLADLARLP